MDITNKDPQYNLSDIIPVVDGNGKFIDFALKTGHPLITDYSQVDKEIIVSENNIMLEGKKDVKTIKNIDVLLFIMAKLIISIFYINQKVVEKLFPYALLPGIKNKKFFDSNLSRNSKVSYKDIILDSNFTAEQKRILFLLIDQLVMDVLYDMYKDNSPYLTLNEYCVRCISYDWDDSIYYSLEKEGYGVTKKIYRECYHAAFAEFIKTKNTSKDQAEIILRNELLQDDIEKIEGDKLYHLTMCIELISSRIINAKNAAYNAMIEEIKREVKVMNTTSMRDNITRLGVDPDTYIDHIKTLNEPGGKIYKRPKYVWDYIHYNGCPDLITSKQFRRNFKRDSNTGYRRFIDEFNRYDKFIENMLPKDNDDPHDYFYKSMDYYHLEIYKRLDFIYNLSFLLEGTGLQEITKEHFFVKRFHPYVFCPLMDNHSKCLRYDEKQKYYRPLLFIEDLLLNIYQRDYQVYYELLIEYNTLRAKAYELYNYSFRFISADYADIKHFIYNTYNVSGYHIKNKEWDYIKNGKPYIIRERVENAVKINKALFGLRK